MCRHCKELRRGYHDKLKLRGKIGQDNGKIYTAWVDIQTADEIQAVADQKGWSRSATIAAMLEVYLTEHGNR